MTKPRVRLASVLTTGIVVFAGVAGLTAAPASADVGPIDHLVISPASAEIAAGAGQDYTAEAFDASNDDLGDVTADSTFTITPDGSCTGASCTATVAGPHTVTGTDGTATGTASLTIDAGPLTQLVSTATPSGVKPGIVVTITSEGFDQYGNDLGDETAVATVAISAGGSCVQNECYSNTDGTYTITTKLGSVSGSTSFQVGARQGITFLKPKHAHLSDGTTTVSATVSSGLDVTFTSSTPDVCTTGGTDGATITLLSTGVCTLVANQAGDTSYLPAHFRKRNFRVV